MTKFFFKKKKKKKKEKTYLSLTFTLISFPLFLAATQILETASIHLASVRIIKSPLLSLVWNIIQPSFFVEQPISLTLLNGILSLRPIPVLTKYRSFSVTTNFLGTSFLRFLRWNLVQSKLCTILDPILFKKRERREKHLILRKF